MKMHSTVWLRTEAWGGCLVAAMVVAGCGMQKPIANQPIDADATPVMPMPMPGQALLAGRVVDADGQPISGAVVKVAETDVIAISDGDGAYQLKVPSDSTVTVVTTAAGFATTYRESVMVAAQAQVSGFDVLMLAPARLTAINTMAGASAGGVMVVRLHSMDPGCVSEGAHISVWPPKGATVMYSAPSLSGGLDQPDTTVTAVQAGVKEDAWLAGAASPGSMLLINVDRAGCALMSQSPSLGGLMYPGLRTVAANALTEVDLFLRAAQ